MADSRPSFQFGENDDEEPFSSLFQSANMPTSPADSFMFSASLSPQAEKNGDHAFTFDSAFAVGSPLRQQYYTADGRAETGKPSHGPEHPATMPRLHSLTSVPNPPGVNGAGFYLQQQEAQRAQNPVAAQCSVNLDATQQSAANYECEDGGVGEQDKQQTDGDLDKAASKHEQHYDNHVDKSERARSMVVPQASHLEERSSLKGNGHAASVWQADSGKADHQAAADFSVPLHRSISANIRDRAFGDRLKLQEPIARASAPLTTLTHAMHNRVRDLRGSIDGTQGSTAAPSWNDIKNLSERAVASRASANKHQATLAQMLHGVSTSVDSVLLDRNEQLPLLRRLQATNARNQADALELRAIQLLGPCAASILGK